MRRSAKTSTTPTDPHRMAAPSAGSPDPMTPPHDPDALAATKFTPPRVPVGWVRRAAARRAARGRPGGPAHPARRRRRARARARCSARGRRSATGPGPSAWLSLDAADRDRRRFWRGVLHALAAARRAGARRVARGAPGRAASTCSSPRSSTRWWSSRSRSCWCSTTSTRSATAACSPTSTGSCAIRRRRCGIVIATRVDPPLRLGRLRLAGRADRDPRGRPRVHRARDGGAARRRRDRARAARTSVSCGGAPRAGPRACASPR